VTDGIRYFGVTRKNTAAFVCIQKRRRTLWLKLLWIE
jgi:hypothetical protein